MYFGLSEDQLFFQDNVSRFLEDHASLEVIKKITEGEGKNLFSHISGDEDTIMGLPVFKIKEYLKNY